MLNQLESLTERVGGSNKLVDRWLHVRKHYSSPITTLVGIKPGKESYMPLNEKALDEFLSEPGRLPLRRSFSIFMNALSAKWKGTQSVFRRCIGKLYPKLLEANTQQIMALLRFAIRSKTPSITTTTLSFQQALSDLGEALEARFYAGR
jgi:regulator of sigma D